MGGRLWKAKNFIRSAFYAVGTHAFKGNVPVISEHRSSWEDLLKFLLQNVIDTCYDQQKNLFRLPQGPQVSFQGVKSDAFELTLRPFIGLGLSLNNIKYSAHPEGDSTIVKIDHTVTPYLKAGARYYISDKFSLFADVGYDKQSVISIGFSCRFFSRKAMTK